jgi:hypothetical protein
MGRTERVPIVKKLFSIFLIENNQDENSNSISRYDNLLRNLVKVFISCFYKENESFFVYSSKIKYCFFYNKA